MPKRRQGQKRPKTQIKHKKTKGFQVEHLFGSKTRVRLMDVFFENPHQSFFVRELTRKVNSQLNSVRRELQNLLDLGALVDSKSANENEYGPAEKKKYFKANTDFILFEDLRAIVQKMKLLAKEHLAKEIQSQGDIHYLALTGTFVGAKDVPTDMLVVGSVNQHGLERIVRAFEKEYGKDINYTVLPKEEFLYRRDVTDRFLYSILESEKIVMINRFDSQL
ncbi:MAG: putative transcriptional regulator [uncultured bacterium]|nr:MAG: putative transcriptional regulator [uncultured bacterium]HBD05634.1 hypothetical protein [Candidatus Uhrbacteria bacterium]